MSGTANRIDKRSLGEANHDFYHFAGTGIQQVVDQSPFSESDKNAEANNSKICEQRRTEANNHVRFEKALRINSQQGDKICQSIFHA